MAHPDFRNRQNLSRRSIPRLTDRLNFYLAIILSRYLLEWKRPANTNTINAETQLKNQVDIILHLEENLRKQRALKKNRLSIRLTQVSICRYSVGVLPSWR